MADDADLAADEQATHNEKALAAQRKIRESQLRNLPWCQECEEERCFVTNKGTISRICKSCYEDMKSRAAS